MVSVPERFLRGVTSAIEKDATDAEIERLRAQVRELRESLTGVVTVLDLLRTYADTRYKYAQSRSGSMIHVDAAINSANDLLRKTRDETP